MGVGSGKLASCDIGKGLGNIGVVGMPMEVQ
jgi:hypothetical protein